MNIDEAVSAHVQWKARLAAYLAKPDQSLKPIEVGADNKCALGQWLHGEGKAHAGKKEFTDVVQKHSEFHKAAAEVVRRANAGEAVSEEVALGARSEFAQASSAAVLALVALKKVVQ
jgi:methyl-accepting chemotaxis protein